MDLANYRIIASYVGGDAERPMVTSFVRKPYHLTITNYKCFHWIKSTLRISDCVARAVSNTVLSSDMFDTDSKVSLANNVCQFASVLLTMNCSYELLWKYLMLLVACQHPGSIPESVIESEMAVKGFTNLASFTIRSHTTAPGIFASVNQGSSTASPGEETSGSTPLAEATSLRPSSKMEKGREVPGARKGMKMTSILKPFIDRSKAMQLIDTQDPCPDRLAANFKAFVCGLLYVVLVLKNTSWILKFIDLVRDYLDQDLVIPGRLHLIIEVQNSFLVDLYEHLVSKCKMFPLRYRSNWQADVFFTLHPEVMSNIISWRYAHYLYLFSDPILDATRLIIHYFQNIINYSSVGFPELCEIKAICADLNALRYEITQAETLRAYPHAALRWILLDMLGLINSSLTL